jgi:hypothetical protein
MNRLLADRPMPGDVHAPRTGRRVSINLAESPLGWLHARQLVTDRQFAAGELLRRDYEAAQLGPRVTMRWDAVPTGQASRTAPDPAGATVAHLAARQRFDGAMGALGPGLSDISWRVLCACEAMPDAEKGLGWPARSGRLVLALALDRIADYYHVP